MIWEPEWRAPSAYCRRQRPAFYLSTFRLPRERRVRILALYAFLIHVDNVMRAGWEQGGRTVQSELLHFSGWLNELFSASPVNDQNFQGLQRTIREADLPRSLFLEILDGAGLALFRQRYRDWSQLDQICRTRSGAPAILTARLLGIDEASARNYAPVLGRSWELTRILCDLDEDLSRGRLFLPELVLAEFQVSEADLVERRESEEIRRLIGYFVERVRQDLDEGVLLLEKLPDHGSRRWMEGYLGLQELILQRIEKDPFSVYEGRSRLRFGDKLRAAWQGAVAG